MRVPAAEDHATHADAVVEIVYETHVIQDPRLRECDYGMPVARLAEMRVGGPPPLS
jgi:hypothetical protein